MHFFDNGIEQECEQAVLGYCISEIITLLVPLCQVFDESALSTRCKEEMYKCYPEAKRAHLKSGGNFPYLARSEDVNTHLEVWLAMLKLCCAIASAMLDASVHLFPDGIASSALLALLFFLDYSIPYY